MTIYGVAILAFCYLVGQLFGEFLGWSLAVKANVGGVGFAMLLLILLTDRLSKNNYLQPPTEEGIQFWNKMYIPVIVAMSSTQNVKLAVSSGFLAILAASVSLIFCFALIPLLAKYSKKS